MFSLSYEAWGLLSIAYEISVMFWWNEDEEIKIKAELMLQMYILDLFSVTSKPLPKSSGEGYKKNWMQKNMKLMTSFVPCNNGVKLHI